MCAATTLLFVPLYINLIAYPLGLGLFGHEGRGGVDEEWNVAAYDGDATLRLEFARVCHFCNGELTHEHGYAQILGQGFQSRGQID